MAAFDLSTLGPVDVPPSWLGYRPKLLAEVAGADAVLRDRGAVGDSAVYGRRHLAIYRADRLIRLFVQLDLHERWELRQRTWPVQDGFRWAVELVGDEHD